MNLFEISNIIKNKNTVGNNHNISRLLTDSRNLSFPSETLFFALKTGRNDGHRYIADLYEYGVRCFVVSELRDEFKQFANAEFLLVENTLLALQQLTEYHRNKYNVPVVGITGSNGKTIVKEWLYQLLHNDLRITRSPRSYNSQIGVPLSVWNLTQNAQLGIFEAGISQPNEMAHLQPIIRPTIGIFTNLRIAHQEGFDSLEQKCEEKLKLFTDSEILIYCSDYQIITDCIKKYTFSAEIFTFGKKPTDNLQIISVVSQNNSSKVRLKYHRQPACKRYNFVPQERQQLRSEDLTAEIKIPFSDNASVENALQCLSAMLVLGYDFATVAARLAELEPVAMRLEVKQGINNCLIINDSYNSDFNSLEIALDFLNHQATLTNLARVAVLSDILQSGQANNELYEEVAKMLKIKNIHHFIGIGTEIGKHKNNFAEIDSYFFENVTDFLNSPVINEFENSIVLLKGARIFHFETISATLESAAHETVLEVNLNALIDNFNYFRSQLRPETKVVCMVKAFAYGAGSVEVVRTLQHHRADYLAVALADEGAELRRAGISLPIMVMNPEKRSFSTVLDNMLEPEIYSFRLLDSFIAAAEKLAITDYPVHIKIDSGMHRLGFDPKDVPLLIEKLQNQSQVKVRSVFSHLAGADNEQFDKFTRLQISAFTDCAKQIQAAFAHPVLLHVLNSAGIERFPEYQFDMVRLGIGFYGISALNNLKISNVCALKTIVLQIRNVEAGQTVGYSRNGLISKDSRIAVLPVGYADGYDRRLGNGIGEVLINGKRAKTVGNICMDVMMVDVTQIDVNEGDKVEIFGENITVAEVAQKINTIPYEILTGISRRVKRIYYQE
ncbi:MAG: bifunctional UDP-N-acetylmuramoyl-tripeptide:D-alanyl-D-alanine ligase/alanine racemase [Prevotellaceae bacterium]|jgi:alanine racemase|nr:bifunctional UDP-N-acetylmuramoyl-tripeptide:D-alanyl-D-alanine ligase/alanine racemase [Prevotellaceae bacterium]